MTACQTEVAVPSPSFSGSVKCRIVSGGVNYSCNILFPGNEKEKITFDSPENVKGMSFSKNGEKNVVSYGSLICRSGADFVCSGSLPAKVSAGAKKIIKDKDSFKVEKTEGGYTFTDGVYSFKTDDEGIITEVVVM